jgi:hypothetical protein
MSSGCATIAIADSGAYKFPMMDTTSSRAVCFILTSKRGIGQVNSTCEDKRVETWWQVICSGALDRDLATEDELNLQEAHDRLGLWSRDSQADSAGETQVDF